MQILLSQVESKASDYVSYLSLSEERRHQFEKNSEPKEVDAKFKQKQLTQFSHACRKTILLKLSLQDCWL